MLPFSLRERNKCKNRHKRLKWKRINDGDYSRRVPGVPVLHFEDLLCCSGLVSFLFPRSPPLFLKLWLGKEGFKVKEGWTDECFQSHDAHSHFHVFPLWAITTWRSSLALPPDPHPSVSLHLFFSITLNFSVLLLFPLVDHVKSRHVFNACRLILW